MTALPSINSRVELLDDEENAYATRVESVDDGLLIVARPDDFPVEGFRTGFMLELIWSTENGVYAAPVEVIQQTHLGRVPVWVTKPSGPTRRDQRRSYVRINLGIPMTMALTDQEADPAPFRCVLMDVSEAALRCRTSLSHAEQLPAETTVRAGFTIDQTAFAVTGSVLRSKIVKPDEANMPDLVEAIVMFDVDDQMASQLRRAVFAEQIRVRNMVRDNVF